MQASVPRLVLAGTNSGCGKTTVACAVLQAFVNRGLKPAACKCGPDYIDPMFHSRIIGAKASNLDSFFFSDDTLRALLVENSRGCGVSVIEGVMGYYDGLGLTSTRASTFELAQKTQSPAVLIVNARGAALSVLASIEGFLRFQPESGIRGVILNGCTAMSYAALSRELETRFGIAACGYLPALPGCTLESRHLGLVTAQEVDHLKEKMQRLAQQAEQTLELDRLLQLANEAPALCFEPLSLPEAGKPVRIGVARDRAFCFYYEDSLNLLRRLGANLIDFSPLHDNALPEDLDGLYLGGGYPELYAQALSGNETMRQSIREAVCAGLPCIAECGVRRGICAAARQKVPRDLPVCVRPVGACGGVRARSALFLDRTCNGALHGACGGLLPVHHLLSVPQRVFLLLGRGNCLRLLLLFLLQQSSLVVD